MKPYRTRPRTVYAVQFQPNNRPWPEGVHQYIDPLTKEPIVLFGTPREYIVVLPGDWIVEDDGERRLVRQDIFDALYEGVGV